MVLVTCLGTWYRILYWYTTLWASLNSYKQVCACMCACTCCICIYTIQEHNRCNPSTFICPFLFSLVQFCDASTFRNNRKLGLETWSPIRFNASFLDSLKIFCKIFAMPYFFFWMRYLYYSAWSRICSLLLVLLNLSFITMKTRSHQNEQSSIGINL